MHTFNFSRYCQTDLQKGWANLYPSSAWEFPSSTSLLAIDVRWLGVKWHFVLVLLSFIWFLVSLCIFALCFFSLGGLEGYFGMERNKAYDWTNLELRAVSLWSKQIGPGSLGLKWIHTSMHRANYREIFPTKLRSVMDRSGSSNSYFPSTLLTHQCPEN